MSSFAVLSTITLAVLLLTRLEYHRHQQRVHAIPHRIHVNGTRGKSSVTRLIGAGLRAGGLSTLTKVTGTFPRLILADGSDVPVHRKAAPSILEQLKIVDFAVDHEAEALVIECMALDPAHQRITEQQMIHATLAVMTNIRLDHTDVMGRTVEEIGRSMAHTIPQGGRVLTVENDSTELLRDLASERAAELLVAHADDVGEDDMAGFSYIEHRENVALALAACRALGIDRTTALIGMWQARPDAGVLTRSRVVEGDAKVTLFNAFAANDPDSTLLIWRKLHEEDHLQGQRFVLLNSRPDRKDRSLQLAHLVATQLLDELATVFVMGEPTDAVVRRLRSLGLSEDRIIDLGKARPEDVYAALVAHTTDTSSVVAIGNMGGAGADTVNLFAERSEAGHG